MENKKSYKDKMKELRGFVDFDYDLRKPLSPRSKGKIEKYWLQLNEAQGQAYRIYRPRNKSRLNKVKDATGFNLPGFKAVIIPSPDPKNPYKVKEKGGQIVFSNSAGEKVFIKFNMPNLLKDADGEITKALNKAKGDRIAIACGKFEYRQRFSSKERAKGVIHEFINTYDNHQKWLFGIYDISIKNQELMDTEMQKKAIYKASTKKQRARLLKGLAKNGKKKNRNG